MLYVKLGAVAVVAASFAYLLLVCIFNPRIDYNLADLGGDDQ